MRKKIIALFVVGIFLLTGISALTVVGKEASVPNQALIEKTITIKIVEGDPEKNTLSTTTATEVCCGEVRIIGTDKWWESTVDIKPELYQNVTIEGEKATLRFYIDYTISKEGILDDLIDNAFVTFNLMLVSVEDEGSVDIDLDRDIHIASDSVDFYKEVKPGDVFTFKITAGLILLESPFIKRETATGAGTIVGKKKWNEVSVVNRVTPIEQPINLMLLQFTGRLAKHFPVFEKILAFQPFLKRLSYL